MRRLSVLAAAMVVSLAAIAALAPRPSIAQEEGLIEGPEVTLFAGGVAVTASYTVECPEGAEGFKISTTIGAVNRNNGLIAQGSFEQWGDCGDGGTSFQVFSTTGVGYAKGPFGGSMQACFGPIVNGEDVECEPGSGGGGLVSGTIN